MQSSVSGLKVQDSWEEVVEHGEKVKDELHSEGMDKDEIKEFDEWKPENGESMTEVRERTIEKASIEEKGSILHEAFSYGEKKVYRLMTLFTPYYYDNDVVNAVLTEKGDEYVFEINISDDDTQKNIKEEIE